MNVNVYFSQNAVFVHCWETVLSNTSLDSMAEAVCCTGLVDESVPVDYAVISEDNDQIELCRGQLNCKID